MNVATTYDRTVSRVRRRGPAIARWAAGAARARTAASGASVAPVGSDPQRADRLGERLGVAGEHHGLDQRALVGVAPQRRPGVVGDVPVREELAGRREDRALA